MLKLYDAPVWHGPGDITLYFDDEKSFDMFKDWASRKVRFKTHMTWEDAGNDPGFTKVLEQQKIKANVATAFSSEAEEEVLDRVGPLDLPEEVGGEDEPLIGTKEKQMEEGQGRQRRWTVSLSKKKRCLNTYRCQTCQRARRT